MVTNTDVQKLVVVNGGTDVLALLETALDAGHYDVVLTDLGMPDMTGWEVARAVKASHPATPVILITGWGDVVEPPQGTVVDAVVTKPFDVTRLTAAVDQALREHGVPGRS